MTFRTTGLAAALATLCLAVSGNASATGYPIGQPTPVDGGFSCRNFDTANLLTEMTVTPVDGVTVSNDGTLDLTVIYYDSTQGWILDWYQENTGPMIRHVVIEDGDTSAHSYSYDPATNHDRLLHAEAAPRVPGGRALYKPLRRATFCYATQTDTPQYQSCPRQIWTSPSGLSSWPASITPGTPIRSLFGPTVADSTIEEALQYGDDDSLEGVRRGLLRESAAAMLNVRTAWLRYPLTEAQVVNFTRSVHDGADHEEILSLTATLRAYNQINCPITDGN